MGQSALFVAGERVEVGMRKKCWIPNASESGGGKKVGFRSVRNPWAEEMLDSEASGIGRREKCSSRRRPKSVGGRNVGFGSVWNRPAGEKFVPEGFGNGQSEEKLDSEAFGIGRRDGFPAPRRPIFSNGRKPGVRSGGFGRSGGKPGFDRSGERERSGRRVGERSRREVGSGGDRKSVV